MYRVNKYVPNCVDDSGIKFETVEKAHDVLNTASYKEAVGDRQLFWYSSRPFASYDYPNDYSCDMLFFVRDATGNSHGALHVKTDTKDEMYMFLQQASVGYTTRLNQIEDKPIKQPSMFDIMTKKAKIAFLAANPSISDADVVIDRIENGHLYARIIPKCGEVWLKVNASVNPVNDDAD